MLALDEKFYILSLSVSSAFFRNLRLVAFLPETACKKVSKHVVVLVTREHSFSKCFRIESI